MKIINVCYIFLHLIVVWLTAKMINSSTNGSIFFNGCVKYSLYLICIQPHLLFTRTNLYFLHLELGINIFIIQVILVIITLSSTPSYFLQLYKFWILSQTLLLTSMSKTECFGAQSSFTSENTSSNIFRHEKTLLLRVMKNVTHHTARSLYVFK